MIGWFRNFAIMMLLLPALSSGGNFEGGKSPARIITAAMIREAGISRISEILTLIPEARFWNIDGFSWQAAINGLGTVRSPGWIVLVDGLRIDVEQFGTISMNLLPVPIETIDSVEVYTTPCMVEGYFSDAGLIHIHTTKPKEGLSLVYRFSVGNETGDPGPFAYTGREAENIDKTGPDVTSIAEYGGRRGFSRAALIVQNHHPTDPAINARYERNFSHDHPVQQGMAPVLNAGYRWGKSEHTLLASHMRLDDFLHMHPIGREAPVTMHMTFAGLAGSLETDNPGIRYRASYQALDLGKRRNDHRLDLDWREEELRAEVEVEGVGRRTKFTLGTGLDGLRISSGYELAEREYIHWKGYVKLLHAFRRGLDQSLDLMIVTDGDETALKTAAGWRWKPIDRINLGLSVSYSERLEGEDGGLWYWSGRGYDLLSDLGVTTAMEGKQAKTRRSTLDLTLDYTPSEAVGLRVTGGLRDFRGQPVAQGEEFDYRLENPSFFGANSVVLDAGGRAAVCGTGAQIHWSEQVMQRLDYSYWTYLGGNKRLGETWRAFPGHQLISSVSYRPATSFAVRARLIYRSAAYWRDFESIGVQTGNRLDAQVNDALSFDLSLLKNFWHERIRATVGFRDLFTPEYNLHPIGWSYNLGFYLTLGVYLDSIL